jgi:hypothetical protein
VLSLPVGGHVWLIDLPDDIYIPHIFDKMKGLHASKKTNYQNFLIALWSLVVFFLREGAS